MPCPVVRSCSNYPQPALNHRKRWRSVDQASAKRRWAATDLCRRQPRWKWRAECCRCPAHRPSLPQEVGPLARLQQEAARLAQLARPQAGGQLARLRVPVQQSRLQVRAQVLVWQGQSAVVARAVPRGHSQRSLALLRPLSQAPALRALAADWMLLRQTVNVHRSVHGDTSNDAWFPFRCDNTSDCHEAFARLERQGSYLRPEHLRRERNCSIRG